MSSVDRVSAFLLERGMTRAEIDAATADDRLHLLVVDALLLAGPTRYTSIDVSDRTGMDLDEMKRFWRALGFPEVGEDEPVFTDADVDIITLVQGLLALRVIQHDTAVAMTRVIGSSMARIAEAQIAAAPLGTQAGVPADQLAELWALTAEEMVPSFARVLEYVWRRHYQAAARRALLRPAELESGTDRLAVGFVDMVGFTALSQQLSEAALGEVVGRFETVAYDSVSACGGRVVKTIGDAAMWVAPDIGAAVEIGLAVSGAYRGDDAITQVRVGISFGEVLAREGDYFGPVVNRANRIVNIALPGTVVVDDAVHDPLAADPRFAWRSLRTRYLKDIGRVPLWSVLLPRTDDPGDSRDGESRARRRPLLTLVSEAGREAIEQAIERRRGADRDS